MSEALLKRWRTLAGDGADKLGRDLIAAYSEPHRHYHTLAHVAWLLDEADRRAALIRDPAMVRFAIWFHDAIYDPERPDNEKRSADWARAALAGRGAIVERVAVLIEKTKKHSEGEANADEALFLDMDMAILGAEWTAYCAYAAGIRAEYAHIVDPAFAAGRGAFLDVQLSRERVFRAELYEQELGENARANMRWEREEMRRGRMVKS